MASSRGSHAPSIGGAIRTCSAEASGSTSQGMARSIPVAQTLRLRPGMGPTRMSYAGDRRALPQRGDYSRNVHHLVGITEIAELMGVTPRRVDQIIRSYPDFPEAEAELAGGRIWKRTAVERWIRAHPDRKPGRPSSQTQ